MKQIAKENVPILINELKSKFKKLRNEITDEKRKSKKKHYHTFFESNKTRTSEIWKGIRELVNTSKSKSSTYELSGVNRNLISDINVIVNKFNNYLSSIGEQASITIPPGNGNFWDYLTNINQYSSFF